MICENCEGSGEVQEHNFDKELDSPAFNIVICCFCNGTGEVQEHNFDKHGTVIGEYYGECPECKHKANLIYQKKGQWVCRWCYYERSRK